ncbi:MAG: amidohydrolase family protein [Anaerolineaceae bacterium]|nr:amidohydrolase family protein [Anaerolineaceae bacterium]
MAEPFAQPGTCDLILEDCSYVVLPDMSVAEGMSIAVDGQRIVAMGSAAEIGQKYTARTTLNGNGKLAMPGMIDAHTHTAHQLLRSAVVDEPPVVWLRILAPFEERLTDDSLYHSARLGCLQMAKAGITGFCDLGTMDSAPIARASIESGMRAVIARRSSDAGEDTNPKSFLDCPEVVVKKTEAFYKEYHGAGNGRISVTFSITSIPNTSPALAETIGAAARQYNTIIPTHLGEDDVEILYCLNNFGVRPVEFLAKYGALGPNLYAGHAVKLSERDIKMLSDYGAKAVHCPWINLTEMGFARTPSLLNWGVPVGLGTDGAKWADIDLFMMMRLLKSSVMAFHGIPTVDPLILPIPEVIKMPTIGSAQALQLDEEVGSLEVGKKADITLLNWHEPHFYPSQKVLPAIVLTACARDVNDVVIDGQWVVKDRKHQLLDEEEVMAAAQKQLKSIMAA